MALKGERMQILTMLEEGKITAQEAAKLLDSLEPRRGARTARRRMLRIRIVDGEGERATINLPLSLAKVALGLAARFDEKMSGVDVERIVAEIEEGAEGRLVEIVDRDRRIEVSVE